jgi:acyl-CoA synthetase (AMP-forming)/AMP-acid ligase II
MIIEAAVIGIPDPVWVERVHGVVVLKDGEAVSGEEIISFCKEHLASYKVPKSIDFMKSLPKNPQGKILKNEIKKGYQKD